MHRPQGQPRASRGRSERGAALMAAGVEVGKVDVKSMYTRDFVLDVCTRFANGETIDSIARSSGERKRDIEALLSAFRPEMEAAFRGAAERSNASVSETVVKMNALERIAVALEQLVDIMKR